MPLWRFGSAASGRFRGSAPSCISGLRGSGGVLAWVPSVSQGTGWRRGPSKKPPAGEPGAACVTERTTGSVAALVDQLVLGDPGHHGAQLGTDLLDRVL